LSFAGFKSQTSEVALKNVAGKGYQHDFSRQAPVILDSDARKLKADKVAAVVLDHAESDLTQGTCLDIGCSGGTFAQSLSPLFKGIVAFDIDRGAVAIAQKQPGRSNVYYLLADSMRIPVRSSSIDVVICNHVYEHVPDAKQLMEEIYRVLKDDGFCYFAAGTWFIIREPHYNLYFLSWLPRPLAHLYVRAAKRGKFYYEELLNVVGLRKLVSRFSIKDYTLEIITQPKRFHAEDLISESNPLTRVPLFILRLIYFFIPTYIWILTKEKRGRQGEERN